MLGSCISNRPSVLIKNKVIIAKIKIKKYGSWNCMPHAIDTLNVFRIEKNSPNNKFIYSDINIHITLKWKNIKKIKNKK